MREEIAHLVYPVLTYGLRLKERVAAGDAPDFRTAQKELQGLLLADAQAARWPDFGGEQAGPGGGFMRGDGGGAGTERFLGIRYALVCWLDDIMIAGTAWKEEWTGFTLEQALYGTRDRAWQFWFQADRAAREGRTDALEAFFLCAMLGFRGEKLDNPDELRTKLKEFQDQIDAGQAREWPSPVGGQPRSFVPPLQGEQRKQKMLVYAVVALLLLIPISMFSLIFLFRPPGG
jgi:type VI secretion system protein ImpK